MNNLFTKSWRRIMLGVAILLISAPMVNAQDNYILYGFRGVPQSMSLNPALTPDASFFVGIPAISNIEVSFFNSAGSYSDFFTRQPGSNVDALDLSKVIKTDNPLGFTRMQINEDLLFVGFKIKKTFFTLGVNQRLSMILLTDNDLFKMINNTDAENSGKLLQMNNTAVDESHMLDYHIGLSIPVTPKITIGARIHLLQGLSNIQTKNSGLTFLTQPNSNNGYDVITSAYLSVNTAGFQTNNSNNNSFSAGQYISDFSNTGFAADLGASVKVNDQLNITASVLDLGSISYSSNAQTYQTNATNLNLTASLSDIFNRSDALSGLGDTLKSLFNATEISQQYSVSLPTRLYVGMEYNLKEHGGRISLLYASQFYSGYNNMAASLAYDYSLGKHFNFKVNYTYIKGDPFNVGTALSFQFKPIQFYVYTDNILTISWKNSKYAQFGFGLNVLFPNKNGERNNLAPTSDAP